MTAALLDRAPAATRPDRTWLVAAVACALIAAQLTLRGVLAWTGEFYWDDLILIGRAGTYPLLSADLLGHDHDGHLMPGAFALAALTTAIAPMQWWPAAVTLVLGQALASLAVLRLLWLLLGPRRVLWGPLLFYLFAPLTLPAFAWWAAALNALPLQAALAWVAGEALQFARTGRRRHLLGGTIATIVALLFFEKAVLVPLVAFATLALTYRVDGAAAPLRRAWRDARPLWFATGLAVAAWAVAYSTLVTSRFGTPPWSMVAGLTHHGLSFGIVPALLGGPWRWDRWNPSPPWADPPLLLVAAAWVAVAAALVWSLRTRCRTGWVWAAAVAYVLASLAAMITTRFGPDTTYELAQTLRYFADSAVIVAVAAALVLRAPRRGGPSGPPPWGALLCATAFTASALVSTVTFARSWTDNPTGDYLATAQAALTARPDVPVLDHPVSVWVLLPVTHPHNLAGSVFAALPGRAPIGAHTTEPQVLDDHGDLVPAELFRIRSIVPGPVPGCGHLVGDDTVTALPFDGPALEWDWTAQIDYLASAAGTIEVGFPGRTPTTVPVEAGPGTVYVQVPGGGNALRMDVSTPGVGVCVGGGLGVVAPR